MLGTVGCDQKDIQLLARRVKTQPGPLSFDDLPCPSLVDLTRCPFAARFRGSQYYSECAVFHLQDVWGRVRRVGTTASEVPDLYGIASAW